MSQHITPELIARLASRIYNEVPHAQGFPTQAPTSPTGMSMPETPVPPAGAPLLPAGATMAPPSGVLLPGMGSATHLPVSGAVPSSFPAQAKSVPFTPGASAPSTGIPNSLAAEQSQRRPTEVASPLPGISDSHARFPQGRPPYPQRTYPQQTSPVHASGAYAEPPAEHYTRSAATAQPTHGGADLGGLRSFVQRVRDTHLGESHDARNAPGPTLHRPLRTSAIVLPHGSRPFDVNAVRADFPILRQHVHGRPLAWFDNAATTQKPQCVIDAISEFYQNDNSNIHRAAHTLAARATDAYEQAREKVRAFLNAPSVKDIVFVRGTTEGINLIAKTFGEKFLQPGDEIVLSELEHHAQIVPWQMIAKHKGALLRVIPVNDRGEIMLEDYQRLLGPRTRVVALAHANNSLGTILPVAEMTHAAKRYGARVIIDGAQSVAHIPVDIQQLGADFYVFSGHKIFGPTGIGAVYIKDELHEFLPPWQGGGNMIRNVTFEETSYSEAPAKFEAGTPNIADAVGLGAALDYVNRLGLPNIAAYEHGLLEYATDHLSRIDGLRLIGNARKKVGVLSFVLPNKRTEEIGKLLDQEGIAVRAGHHCAQPSLRRFGVETTVRPSLSIYNTCEEVDRLVEAVRRIRHLP